MRFSLFYLLSITMAGLIVTRCGQDKQSDRRQQQPSDPTLIPESWDGTSDFNANAFTVVDE